MTLRHRRSFEAPKRVILTCMGAASILGVTAVLKAQPSDFNTEITIEELMEAIVMPSADIIWSAVVYDSTQNGDELIGPETDEGWDKLRWGAIALAEAANSLVIPGRHAAPAGTVAGEGELAPMEIEALIAKERPAWVAYAHTLHTVAMQTAAAADAHDADQIFEIGGAIDTACEACHLQFWYPNQ
jgi:hypothetical protein